MPLLILPVTAVALALLAAGAGAADDADARIAAAIEAGEIRRAAELAQATIDREAETGRPGAQIAGHLERLADRFYGTASPEGAEVAERLYDRALLLRQARSEAEPAPLAGLLHNLSGIYFNRGDYGKAEDAERRALAIYERIDAADAPRLAESRRDLGLIFLIQGRLKEASSLLVSALPVIENAASSDFTQVAVGRNYLAELYRLQGRYADAAALLEELVQQAPDKLGEDNPQLPYFLNNLAGVYRDQERFDEAETLLRRSLSLRKAAVPRDDGAVARALLNLAELVRVQGKLAEAEPLYLEASTLARGALGGDSPELLEFVSQTAVLYRDEGRLEEAEVRLREAVDLAQRGFGPDHLRVAQCRLDLAEVLRARKRCDVAETQYRRAIEIRLAALGPAHPDLAEALTAHAQCLAADPARRSAARADLGRAIEILGSTEAHPAVAVDAHALLADLEMKAEPARGRADLAEALRIVESMRPHRGGGEGVRAEFFGRYRPLYERMVRLEVESNHPDRALEAVERGRARVLLDQLAAAHVGDAAPQDAKLLERQAAARADLAEIRERLTFEQSRTDLTAAARRSRVGDLERRLEEATRAFRGLYDEARNASPAWRGAAPGDPASAAEIQQDVVPRDGVLLVYEIGIEGSYVLVVPPRPGPVEAYPLTVPAPLAKTLGITPGPLTAGTLASVLTGPRGMLAALASPRGTLARGIGRVEADLDPQVERLHALWRVLLPRDAWTRCTRAAEVLVVPDGPLCLLPFETLVLEPGPDPGSTRFWLDAGPVVRYAPSATFVHEQMLRAPSERGAKSRFAALSVSDPAYAPAPAVSGGVLARLPGTATESRAVREAFGAIADVVVLDGAAAREPAVRKELPGKRYVHIATHGIVDEARGEIFAGLALTPPETVAPSGDDDGFLQLFEIYDLRLNAELAVLSACSSNAGRVVTGEGIFALSRGFLVAGARRVVASQWAVEDASTAELVGELFRSLAAAEKKGEPLGTARALRDAKRQIRHAKPEWAHPFFWAPFVLTGAE